MLKWGKSKTEFFLGKINSPNLTLEIIKRAKKAELYQVLNFSVSKGYLHQGKINWGLHDHPHDKHPHIIELIDTEEKIELFLKNQENLLNGALLFMVKEKATRLIV